MGKPYTVRRKVNGVRVFFNVEEHTGEFTARVSHNDFLAILDAYTARERAHNEGVRELVFRQGCTPDEDA